MYVSYYVCHVNINTKNKLILRKMMTIIFSLYNIHEAHFEMLILTISMFFLLMNCYQISTIMFTHKCTYSVTWNQTSLFVSAP